MIKNWTCIGFCLKGILVLSINANENLLCCHPCYPIVTGTAYIAYRAIGGKCIFKKMSKIAVAGNRLPKHKLLGPALPVTCLQRQQIIHSEFWSFFSKD